MADAPGSRPPAIPRGPGRRSGRPETREQVLEAARSCFAARGYDATTMREVAADAGVDSALVHYFFGTKEKLFAAAMALPVTPADILDGVLAGGLDGVGERLVRSFLGVLDDERSGGPLVALIRSSATREDAAGMLREFLTREVVGRAVTALERPAADLRTTLAGSQLVGLVMARYIVRIEPLASADHDTIAGSVGPTLQRYLTGELPGLGDEPAG